LRRALVLLITNSPNACLSLRLLITIAIPHLILPLYPLHFLQLGTLVPIATPAPPTTVAPSMRFDLQSKNLLNSPPPLLNTPTVSGKCWNIVIILLPHLLVLACHIRIAFASIGGIMTLMAGKKISSFSKGNQKS